MTTNRADLTELMVYVRPILPDKLALKFQKMYPHWKPTYEDENGEKQVMKYEEGQRVQHDGILWRCISTHTVDDPEGWKPGVAPSLFDKVLIPDETQIYPWEQPGSTNGYKKGDKVTHNGKTWESQQDNNVWEPGAVGTENIWKEVTETE